MAYSGTDFNGIFGSFNIAAPAAGPTYGKNYAFAVFMNVKKRGEIFAGPTACIGVGFFLSYNNMIFTGIVFNYINIAGKLIEFPV